MPGRLWAGRKFARSVSTRAAGPREPAGADRDRLCNAFHAAALLRERYDVTTVKSWFKGMNPALDDDARAKVLREPDPLAVPGT